MIELAKGFENGLWDVTDEEYFADVSHISRSMFSDFLLSPVVYRSLYVDQSQSGGKSSRSMARGTAVHLALLNPHQWNEIVAVEPTEDQRTAMGAIAWRKYRDQIRAGKLPLSKRDSIAVRAQVEAIMSHKQAVEFLTHDGGTNEQIIRWIDPASNLPLKGKLDRMVGSVIVDVKTTSKALNARQWARECRKHGYHIQAAWYVEGAKMALGRTDMTFAHVVVTAENTVFCCYFAKEYLDRLWEETVRPDLCRLAETYANDTWTMEADGIVEIPME